MDTLRNSAEGRPDNSKVELCAMMEVRERVGFPGGNFIGTEVFARLIAEALRMDGIDVAEVVGFGFFNRSAYLLRLGEAKALAAETLLTDLIQRLARADRFWILYPGQISSKGILPNEEVAIIWELANEAFRVRNEVTAEEERFVSGELERLREELRRLREEREEGEEWKKPDDSKNPEEDGE